MLGSRGVLSAFDELRMSVSRFFLKQPGDVSVVSPGTAAPRIDDDILKDTSLREELLLQRCGLGPLEVPSVLSQLSGELLLSKERIAICFTRHRFLKNLKTKEGYQKQSTHDVAATTRATTPSIRSGNKVEAHGGADHPENEWQTAADDGPGPVVATHRTHEAVERASRAGAAALYRQQHQQQLVTKTETIHQQQLKGCLARSACDREESLVCKPQAQQDEAQRPQDEQQQDEHEQQQQDEQQRQQQQQDEQQRQQQKQQARDLEEEPQRCPICLQSLNAGGCVAVLPCGHSTCFSCLQKLQQKQQQQQRQQQRQQPHQQQRLQGQLLKCAICRHRFNLSAAALVATAATAAPAEAPEQQQQQGVSRCSRTPSPERSLILPGVCGT